MGAFRPETGAASDGGPRVYQMDRARAAPADADLERQPEFAERAFPSARVEDVDSAESVQADGPLGAAKAQLHGNYIVAQTPEGMVIVDQHAAHERLVYEDLKAQYAERGIAAQALLIPEIVDVGDDGAERLLARADELSRLGLAVEPFGGGAVAVREIPALLGQPDVKALLEDILDELQDAGDSLILQARIDAVLSRIACHGSIRSGRQMRADEMNALLRRMEATPHSGQCNHGRPTYVELSLADIERLFMNGSAGSCRESGTSSATIRSRMHGPVSRAAQLTANSPESFASERSRKYRFAGCDRVRDKGESCDG